jgi:hypothetical protein
MFRDIGTAGVAAPLGMGGIFIPYPYSEPRAPPPKLALALDDPYPKSELRGAPKAGVFMPEARGRKCGKGKYESSTMSCAGNWGELLLALGVGAIEAEAKDSLRE